MTEQTTTVDNQELLGEIMGLTNLDFDSEGYELAKTGVETMLERLLTADEPQVRVDKALVDLMIEELDVKLGQQLDEILHNERFKEYEASWRGLQFLVNRTDFDENIKIEILNTTKDELLEDFQDAPKLSQSGLYHIAYTQEYGQFGGEPIGVMIADFEFSYQAQDVELLTDLADLCSVTHAPFISSVSPKMFGLNSFNDLSGLAELESIFDGPQYSKWRTLRDHDHARNLGLVLPKFMGRSLYGEDQIIKSFEYKEAIENKDEYLWSNAAYAYTTRLTESFAKYRWCPNIIGPQSGGALLNLPIDVVEENGARVIHGPVETVISDRKELELAELGFIGLSLRKGADNATFFSSNSLQRPKQYGSDPESRQAELNFRLGTQLPYLFIVNRLAHYIKVLQRENLGSWKSKADLDSELNKWIRQYIADQENPSPATRSQRPLRKALVTVTEVEGEAGWYQVGLEVTPHFKFMGANFTLSLTGILERS